MALSEKLYIWGRGPAAIKVRPEMVRALERVGTIWASRAKSVKWSPAVVARYLLVVRGPHRIGEDSSAGVTRDALEDALREEFAKHTLTLPEMET